MRLSGSPLAFYGGKIWLMTTKHYGTMNGNALSVS